MRLFMVNEMARALAVWGEGRPQNEIDAMAAKQSAELLAWDARSAQTKDAAWRD